MIYCFEIKKNIVFGKGNARPLFLVRFVTVSVLVEQYVLPEKKNTATAKFAPKKFFYGFFPVFRTNWHSAVLKEHTAVTNNVGLKDLSTFAKFRVKSGPKTSERNKLFLKKNNFKGIH